MDRYHRYRQNLCIKCIYVQLQYNYCTTIVEKRKCTKLEKERVKGTDKVLPLFFLQESWFRRYWNNVLTQ